VHTKSVADASSASYAQKLIAIQKAFAEGPEVIALTELSEKLTLPCSTTHRLLEPLVNAGLIERAPGRRYRIGAEMFRISAIVTDRYDLVANARVRMREIVARTGQTCMLGLLSRNRCDFVVAEKFDGVEPLGADIKMYQNQPLVWGSLGRSILAFLGHLDIQTAVAAAHSASSSAQFPPDFAQIRDELHEIHRDGVAMTRGQMTSPERLGISVPVFGADGNVRGSIGVAAHPVLFDLPCRVRTSTVLREQAFLLSQSLGYVEPRLSARAYLRH
jgi:DNA-binding IclR family transcriptional regulator